MERGVMASSAQSLPFEDLVVVELGDRLGAAACGSLLASVGATVIAIEPAEPIRTGKHLTRAISMAGKQSLVVRPGSDEDQKLLHTALAAADVVIISSDIPGAPDYAGHISKDAIVCDVAAFPDNVPHADRMDDKLIQALSGIGIVTGTADGMPTLSDAAILELGAGIYAAAAVVAALRVRRMHGGGQHVGSSLYGTGVNGLVTFLPFHFSGKMPSRGGNRHPMCAPWNAYQATDGWLLLCSANDDQWRRLCNLMGRGALADTGDLATLAGRIKHIDTTDAVVQAWVGTKSVYEAVTALGSAGIAAGPIVPVEELGENANVKHRSTVRHLLDPETNTRVAVAAPPLKLGRTPSAIPARNSGRDFVRGMQEKPTQAAPTKNTQIRPLAGLRVLEIGQYTTAPLAAKQLATLGADVLKIEPLTGESSRAWPPHLNGESYFFTMNNANKRSLAADLRRPDDRALFVELIKKSDVLVENLKPGSLARLGFSYEELKKINPRLVYSAISGYGADSIYPGRPAFDTVIQAMCGLMDLTRAEGVPTKIGISIADTLGGTTSLFCILAMLEQRDRTGIGAFIDLAMQDVGIWATQNAWMTGNRHPHTTLACKDGYVAVLATTDKTTYTLQSAGIDPKASTRDETVAALFKHDLAAAPVRSVDEIGVSDQRDNGFIRMVQAGERRWPLLEPPFRLSRMRDYPLNPIGALGAANEDFRRTES
ncbi:MAG: CoA transferase [Rhizobiales bacterium]|nr:CoA transferase [Hyphomicrobiales bacterium]